MRGRSAPTESHRNLMLALAATAVLIFGWPTHAHEPECAPAAEHTDAVGEHYVVWWGDWARGAAVVAPNGLVARRFDDVVLATSDDVWAWQSDPRKVTIERSYCLGEPECEQQELAWDRSLVSTMDNSRALAGGTPTELDIVPQGYEFAETLDWSVPGVAGLRVEEAIYVGGYDDRDVTRSDSHRTFWLDESTERIGAESLLSSSEHENLEALCREECVFSIHASGGWSGGEFAGIRLEVLCDARDAPVPRVVALFERETTRNEYWVHDLAQLVLERDQIPEVIAEHWPPPSQVTEAACENRDQHRRRVQAFGWSTVGAGPALEELLGD